MRLRSCAVCLCKALNSPVAIDFCDTGILVAHRVGLGGVMNKAADSDAKDAEQESKPDDRGFSRSLPELPILDKCVSSQKYPRLRL